MTPPRPAGLSDVGGAFAAGILRHAGALSALTAPSPVSDAAAAPHRWSAGAVCLGPQNREALLRIPPLVTLGGGEPAAQLRLEYRGADATANPYLALGAILMAGLAGVREELRRRRCSSVDPASSRASRPSASASARCPPRSEEALEALESDELAAELVPAAALRRLPEPQAGASSRPSRSCEPGRALQALWQHLLSRRAQRLLGGCSRDRRGSSPGGRPAPAPARNPELAHAEQRTAAPSPSGSRCACRSVAGHRRACPDRLEAARWHRWRSGPSSTACRSEEQHRQRRSAPTAGTMHACGHDVHMAALVALARAAHPLADALPAPLLALFQPSEEAYPSGAEELGARSSPEIAPAAVVAAHVHPELRLGNGGLDPGRRQRLLRRRRDRDPRRARRTAPTRIWAATRSSPSPRWSSRCTRRWAGGSTRSAPAVLTVGVDRGRRAPRT